MLLQNNEIYLRAVEPEDLDYLYKWENDTNLWIHGNTLAPYSKNTLRQYIEEAQQYDIFESNQLRLVMCKEGGDTIVGAVDIYDVDVHSRRAGIGLLVDEEFRQQGFAQQALELVKAYAFEFLDLHQLYAHISVNNQVSIDLFKKAGYNAIGILKDWIHTPKGYNDVVLVQLIENDKHE